MSSDGPAYLQTLGEFLCSATLDDLPDDVLDRGRWIIADTVGAIAAGMRVSEMREFASKHLDGRREGSASVIGHGATTLPSDAALINGTASTWLEQDEGNLYAKGHPGAQVVPAALAVAEAERLSGSETLLAVILGYEACSRINRASKSRLEFHPHGTYGPIGAAVAVGKLMRYTPPEMITLLNVASNCGIATSRGSILEGVTVRNIYTGMSGYMGVLAHQMVSSGFTGERDGVGYIFSKIYGTDFDRAMVVEGLGESYLTARNYFKVHACGRYIHSALDLAEALIADCSGNVDVDAIDSIRFRSYYMASTLSRKDVRTSFEARFSVPFAVASLLWHGKAGLENFEDQAVANPKIHALAQKVEIVEEPEFTKHYPQKQLCDVVVRFKDGRTFEAQAEYIKGENENPHPPGVLREKFMTLGEGTWDRAAAGNLLDGLLAIDTVTDMRAFATEHALAGRHTD